MAAGTVAVPDLGTRRGMAAGFVQGFGTRGELGRWCRPTEAYLMNRIIWIIGAIVVVLAILSFLGLR